MGRWSIAIEGTGAHHNADYPQDANKMAEEFVGRLKSAGHQVEHATFTSGSRDFIDPALSALNGYCANVAGATGVKDDSDGDGYPEDGIASGPTSE